MCMYVLCAAHALNRGVNDSASSIGEISVFLYGTRVGSVYGSCIHKAVVIIMIQKKPSEEPPYEVYTKTLAMGLEETDDPVPGPKFGCVWCNVPNSLTKKKKIWLSCGHVIHYDCINTSQYRTSKPYKWLCPECMMIVLRIGILFG
ncbi:RING-type domain-containing protein [Trichonephila clavata]|uniref:RING-type domain-containing protein n=1 Tax=Trichonephila clavata TaxID=2740835 RepID=A0A8X6KKM8_TRICU|nr:RING-type domain-containing protein [Trichonephila clavata]